MKVDRFLQKIKMNNFFNFMFTVKYNADNISTNFASMLVKTVRK